MAAVRALVAAGADVDKIDTRYSGVPPVFAAVRLDMLVYLVEECNAKLCFVCHSSSPGSLMGWAASRGDLAVLTYLAKKSPEMVDCADNEMESPIMYAAGMGHTGIVRHLARLGCRMYRQNFDGRTAFDWSRARHPATAQLLSGIDAAGGWSAYACMEWARLRHVVSRSFAVLDEAHPDRELLHFVLGRNRVDEEKPMLALPTVLFNEVIKFLEGGVRAPAAFGGLLRGGHLGRGGWAGSGAGGLL